MIHIYNDTYRLDHPDLIPKVVKFECDSQLATNMVFFCKLFAILAVT